MNQSTRESTIPWAATITAAFSTSIVLWTAWFTTHLPWVGLAESVSMPVLLVVWLVACAASIRWISPTPRISTSVPVGVLSAVCGLLVVGSKLVEAPATDGAAGPVKPNAAVIALGFLALGAVVGTMGGVIARAIPGHRRSAEAAPSGQAWLGRLAFVTACSIFPLLLVGGLVTTTGSGMAVPDWPNTYGSNMFLYPLGPRSDPARYLEHSHRLFGALIGLTSLVCMIATTVHGSGLRNKVWSIVLFVLVCVQGTLGGLRVLHNSPYEALVHGVLGQIVFGWAVILAAMLSPAFGDPVSPTFASDNPRARRLRRFATASLHLTTLQLLMGAWYRHLRSPHALYTHMGLSVLVLALVILAVIAALDLKPAGDSLTRSLRRAGYCLLFVVAAQFLLGWAAWSVPKPLIRSAHQGNGALTLALVAWIGILGLKVPRPRFFSGETAN
jgi:cytochrome c oxidase assembly protein subunit 15